MSTQLQKSETKRDILALIQSDKVKQQFALALPKHITADRMARVACTAIMRTPKLMQCTQESLLNCLMQCSQFGLEPDGRRAHLIPYENRKTGVVECTLQVDWKGLAELVLRSGIVAKLHADLICDKDEFAYDLGDILHHRINWRQPRGEPYAAYAMAVTKTGEKFVQVMTKDEIEKIRDNSQGWRAFKQGYAKQSPWQDAPGEMWKKTVFRRLSKWLPLSPENRDAIEMEDEVPEISSPLPDKPVFSLGEPSPEVPAIEAPAAPIGPENFIPENEPTTERPQPNYGPGNKKPATPEPEKPASEPVVEPPSEPAERTPSFEEVVDGQEPEYLKAARHGMAAANITEAQVVSFWNEQKKASLTSLGQIPEANLKKMLGSAAIVENIRKVKE